MEKMKLRAKSLISISSPLLGKEGMGVVDYSAYIDTAHAMTSSTTPNPSFLRRGNGYHS